MIQMHMHAGQDDPLESMLNVGQLIRQIPNVVIIDKGNAADCLLILIPLLPDQIVAYEIPQCLRSIRILLPRNVPVEVI